MLDQLDDVGRTQSKCSHKALRQIASIYALVVMALLLPLVLAFAMLYGTTWGNFTVRYDTEDGKQAINNFWLLPCWKLIQWGWKEEMR